MMTCHEKLGIVQKLFTVRYSSVFRKYKKTVGQWIV